MTLRAFRVGVVGARKARQGVGEHLARFCHTAGAKVVAVAGTSKATAVAAALALSSRGITATPYDDVAAMIVNERLDALVIASPVATHARYLALALDAGLHVLCEKPILDPDDASVVQGTSLVERFASRGLLLAVNVQWRHALGAYMLLFPEVAPRAATSFELEMSPLSEGLDMIPDALPHALSVLDHLFPGARELIDVDVSFASPREATVTFLHPGDGSGDGKRVRSTVRLSTHERAPRPAAIGFGGHLARREIEEPGYRLYLRADDASGRRVPLPDPMEAVVRRFVERVRKGPPYPVDSVTVTGLVHLRQIVVAAARVAPASNRG